MKLRLLAPFTAMALATPGIPAQTNLAVIPLSSYSGGTTNDLFAPAIINTTLSQRALPGFSLDDIFGKTQSSEEPGNTIFIGGLPGSVSSLYFSLPAPTNRGWATKSVPANSTIGSDGRPARRATISLTTSSPCDSRTQTIHWPSGDTRMSA